jgi:hypothetical protein
MFDSFAAKPGTTTKPGASQVGTPGQRGKVENGVRGRMGRPK